MKWKSILAIVVIATPSTAFADVNCRFTIASLSMTDDGWISASFNGTGFTKSWWLCSMGGAVTLSDGFGTRNITGFAERSILRC